MVNIDVMARGVQKYTDPETGERFDLPYRVYFPTGYDAKGEKHYPMLFFLHGHGECGTDNEQQIHVLHKENRLLNLVMERDDCIIVAPQCPCNVKYEWVPLAHAWSTGSRELSEKPTIGLAAAMALLDRFLCSEAVDKKRVYAAGISMGGYGMWELITRRPEVFAAAFFSVKRVKSADLDDFLHRSPLSATLFRRPRRDNILCESQPKQTRRRRKDFSPRGC